MDSNSGKGGKKKPATKKLDFYELLELDKSATPEQIKTTYKKLALVSFVTFHYLSRNGIQIRTETLRNRMKSSNKYQKHIQVKLSHLS